MQYEGVVYRPPSEARSLIIQVTIGCSNNSCTFCSMYKEKTFRIRRKEEIFADLKEMAAYYGTYRLRVFLADGDALVLPTDFLLEILHEIRKLFPYVERVTAYGTALDVIRKSAEERKRLKQAGLSMIYLGAESGDPVILQQVQKHMTVEDMIQAAECLKEAEIMSSVTFISGLGGKERLREHALASAELTSKMKPDYVGFLTLMLEEGVPIIKEIESGKLTLLESADVVEEMRIYLQHVDSQGTVFRANHASNYVSLKGTLNQDIPDMLAYLDRVEKEKRYRPESYRRL